MDGPPGYFAHVKLAFVFCFCLAPVAFAPGYLLQGGKEVFSYPCLLAPGVRHGAFMISQLPRSDRESLQAALQPLFRQAPAVHARLGSSMLELSRDVLTLAFPCPEPGSI